MVVRNKIHPATSATPAYRLRDEISEMLNRIYWSVDSGENLIFRQASRPSEVLVLSIHRALLSAVDVLQLNDYD